MPDSNDRTPLDDLLKNLKGSGTKEAVALLGLIQLLKEEAGLAAGTPAPGTDVLFQLAKLQMSTISQLAQIGSDETSKLVDFFKQRREAQRASEPASRALVTISEKDDAGSFSVKNPSTRERKYPLPEFVHLEQIGQRGAEGADYYLEIKFYKEKEKTNALCTLEIPGKSTEGQPGQVSATLVVKDIKRLGQSGHFRGRIRFEAEGSPALELIVEIYRGADGAP
jgi:hypothetical protein